MEQEGYDMKSNITIKPYESLGNYDFGWLNARYHFSFGHYYDPKRMGFGALRVVNDDIVAPNTGFDTHPHKDMEIITFVRSGAITHRDSTGNEGRTEAGDVQVMSAGTGIEHSEKNAEDVATTLFQIWIMPREKGVAPRWDARQFPKKPVNDALPLLVSGRESDKDKGALFIHADASVYGGRLEKGTTITQNLDALGYMLISEGSVEIDGQFAERGDAAQIEGAKTVTIKALEDSELVLIDVAA
jgi:redox-sensitive bicupin YhaK (pirin superfamily)